MEITTMSQLSRRAFAAIVAISVLMPGGVYAADPLREIHIDWATYNPVSMILKQKGLLEKEFAKDGIGIVWVLSAGSNKALEFLNAGSIDFGSTAGSAALVAKINGNPIKSIYVYSLPEWTALVSTKDSSISDVAATRLQDAVIDRQLKERTELTHSRIGPAQRESILAAGLALQQAGVIDAKADVKATLDALIDDQVPLPTN